VICNEEDTDGRARLTADEEQVWLRWNGHKESQHDGSRLKLTDGHCPDKLWCGPEANTLLPVTDTCLCYALILSTNNYKPKKLLKSSKTKQYINMFYRSFHRACSN